MLRKSENFLALRLENVSLREPLSDLRAGNANLIFAHGVRKELGENLPVPQPTQKGQAVAALGYSRCARKFFATPLVSELPDGFGSNANLIRYTFGVRSYARHTGAAANRKAPSHPAWCFSIGCGTRIRT